jgi:hypothetical protein
MSTSLPTAEEIVSKFGGQSALARDLDRLEELKDDVSVTYRTCQNWVQRNNIPSCWFLPIYLVAKRRKIGVTMTMLLQHAARGVIDETKILEGVK